MVLRKFQFYEWQRHKLSVRAISIVIVTSFLGIALIFMIAFIYAATHNMNSDFHQTDTGQHPKILFNHIEQVLFAFRLLPVVGYLTYRQLVKPHDCYDCFNRVP